MEALILATYSFFCWLIFKVFKIPVNKWTLTTAVLGGIILIVSAVLMMNYNHPYTSNARTYFVSTPMIASVNSKVTTVPVKEQQHVKKGDTLYTLDSTLFVSRYRTLIAGRKLAQTRLNESRRLARARAGSQYDVEKYQAEVESFNAQLIEARWNIDECVITAPGDGLITQVRLRPGMRSTNFPLRPLMTFIDTKKYFVVAGFPQNPMQRVAIGDEAELIFDAIPGALIKGKVARIGEALFQGEVQANGTLINLDTPQGHVQGSVPIYIEITDDMSEYFLPGGAKCQVAVYTKYMHHVAVIRKMLLRMKGWTNFVFGEH